MKNLTTIGDVIKKLIEEKNTTAYMVAKKGKISNSYLSDLLNNKRKNPSIDALKKIADGLDVSVQELIN